MILVGVGAELGVGIGGTLVAVLVVAAVSIKDTHPFFFSGPGRSNCLLYHERGAAKRQLLELKPPLP